MRNFSKFFVSGIIMMVFVVPFLVQAADAVVPGQPAKDPIVITNPFKQNTIVGLINTILDEILIPVGGVVAVLMIMWAGFLYVTAGGDPGQIKKAHDALLWAIIGAAILLGAKVLSTAIQGTISTLSR